MGPYATRAEAERALETAAQRTEAWDEDPKWKDELSEADSSPAPLVGVLGGTGDQGRGLAPALGRSAGGAGRHRLPGAAGQEAAAALTAELALAPATQSPG